LTGETSYGQGSQHLPALQIGVLTLLQVSCQQRNWGWYSSP